MGCIRRVSLSPPELSKNSALRFSIPPVISPREGYKTALWAGGAIARSLVLLAILAARLQGSPSGTLGHAIVAAARSGSEVAQSVREVGWSSRSKLVVSW